MFADSERMFKRRDYILLARMPSLRTQALNSGKGAANAVTEKPTGSANSSLVAQGSGNKDSASLAAGGFHESSYELQQGLDVSESEWPPDVTIPGALGDG